ncbi:trace amine-associated receptor 7f-like [Dendronephthya gigantea]|uniref:trace amine-associated receptor 7f-like n=1 Tax=Dendronephthya gigantea TaxID=151771 RepID=UPI00106BD3E8|nr:trace amine-associated receptor 7f-like [Dendronephthya gigantea]
MSSNISHVAVSSTVVNESFVPTFSEPVFVSVTVITIAILVLAIPANTLVLVGYLKGISALKKPANYLLINLTVLEFILSIIVIPFQLLVNFIKPRFLNDTDASCVIVGILVYPFYIAATITMIFISVDRYYAIRAPFKYKFMMGRSRIACMVGYSWLHSVAFIAGFGCTLGVGYDAHLGVCGVLWNNNMIVSSVAAVTHILLPFFLLLALNINLVVSLRNQNRTAVNNLDYRQGQIWKTRQAQERRITCLVFWIICTFLVSWLPYLVTRGLWVIFSKPTLQVFCTFATTSLQLSVVIDPVLNLVFRKDLRTTLERLILRKRNESITLQTGRLNLGASVVPRGNRCKNTKIFVRPRNENSENWLNQCRRYITHR